MVGPPEGAAEGGAAEKGLGSALGSTVGSTGLDAELGRLEAGLAGRARGLALLESWYLERRLRRSTTPRGRPVRHGWVSSRYGWRTDPFTGLRAFHQGVDVAGRAGEPVRAVADGVVTWAGRRYGYGLLVEIAHGRGYVTRYGHNREVLVQVGQRVRQGEVIARMGSTGRSTGPHVHFEVLRDGRPVDPLPYLRAAR
ncbi:MAG: M23 family metallopeptidase [Gammaproteobacteria bacterium]|nr:MAG: M23 family metallopeptidase [Gammaproteobacteria bacterium]